MSQVIGNTDLTGNLMWFAAVAIIGFLVSWLVTEKMGLNRTQYVGVLALVTAAVTAGYVFWSGAGADFWTNNWALGVLGAAVAAVFLALLLSRLNLAAGKRAVSLA